jgi:hypothetical protein
MLELYLHSHIYLHGVLLDRLRPGIILPHVETGFWKLSVCYPVWNRESCPDAKYLEEENKHFHLVQGITRRGILSPLPFPFS